MVTDLPDISYMGGGARYPKVPLRSKFLQKVPEKWVLLGTFGYLSGNFFFKERIVQNIAWNLKE